MAPLPSPPFSLIARDYVNLEVIVSPPSQGRLTVRCESEYPLSLFGCVCMRACVWIDVIVSYSSAVRTVSRKSTSACLVSAVKSFLISEGHVMLM